MFDVSAGESVGKIHPKHPFVVTSIPGQESREAMESIISSASVSNEAYLRRGDDVHS